MKATEQYFPAVLCTYNAVQDGFNFYVLEILEDDHSVALNVVGSIKVSEKLPTYPSPKVTFCPI